MITEDYVSFESAKLLKEKGFEVDRITMLIGSENKPFLSGNSGYEYLLKLNHEVYPAPTLQMAMKWLREEYNLHVDICYDDLDWSWNILSVDKSVPVEERPKFIKDGFAGNKTYQEALEEGIKYCLEKLI